MTLRFYWIAFWLLFGFAVGASIRQATSAGSISLAEFKGALTRAGIVQGAGQTNNGQGYVIDQLRVSAQGDWFVVRIKPRRIGNN